MKQQVAVIGAGVSGLTCGVLLAEHGYRTVILARESGQQTTSAVAAALWFPYDAEPADKVIPWAIETYRALLDLMSDLRTGVTMIELRQFSRSGDIQIPAWSHELGAKRISSVSIPGFVDGFTMQVPLADTTIYLDYLKDRFCDAGGELQGGVAFENFEDVDSEFDVIVNCAGIGARELVPDANLVPHRGQVAVVPPIEGVSSAVVCDDAPLTYVIPRQEDCIFGGTNQISNNLDVDPKSTAGIVAECSRVLGIDAPRIVAEKVGLRPFRKAGVRLDKERRPDGRSVIHDYGHGGSGFTLSWGCAREVLGLIG